jgi:hypothetical protein
MVLVVKFNVSHLYETGKLPPTQQKLGFDSGT